MLNIFIFELQRIQKMRVEESSFGYQVNYEELYEQQRCENVKLKAINEQLTELLKSNDSSHGQMPYQKQLAKQMSILKNMYQVDMKMERQKVEILEQGRSFLLREIQLLKQQITHKQEHIGYLSETIINIKPKSSQIDPQSLKKFEKQLIERQGIIDKLKMQMQSYKNGNKQSNQQLSQITSKMQLMQKQYQTNKIQLDYYKQENTQFSAQINELSQKLSTFEQEKEQEMKFQAERWVKIQQTLLSRIDNLEKNGTNYQNRQDKMYRDLRVKNQQIEKQKAKNKQIETQLNWYKKLLDEAKGQFIHAQLQQEEKNMKLKIEKETLLRETHKLKKQITSTKSQSRTLQNSRFTNGKNLSIISLLEKTPEKAYSSIKSKKNSRQTARKS